MRIENLIFATKKNALRQWVELFSTHWRNIKAKPIKFKHFYKKQLTSLFLHFSKSKQEMEIQNTLFVVECTRAEILRRAKIARAKFSIKNMSWNLPFTCLFLMIICSFSILKPRFLQQDGISITLNVTGFNETLKETYITSYLYIFKPKLASCCYVSRKSWIILLCLMCGDIEINPGPSTTAELLNLLRQKGNHIFHQNIRGLFSKKELVEEFLQRSQNVSIFALSETLVNRNDIDEMFDIPGSPLLINRENPGKEEELPRIYLTKLNGKGEKIWKTMISSVFC